jgi:Domain of unknown function (DUF4388)
VRLEGSLDAFSLPDIFSLLSMTKKTGGLHLRRSDAHGVVWLGDGLVSGGASNLSRLSLGRRLAGSDHISEDALSAAVETVGSSADVGLARALRDAGAIDDDDLVTLVSEHVVDTVFDLMRWTEGVFEFVVDEPNIDDVGVTRPVEDVVTEARTRLDTWSALDESLSSPATVLSLALHPDVDPKLQRDEWGLLALVDGHRSVGDLVTLCGRGEYSVVVALSELVEKGLVLLSDSGGVAALQRRQDLVGSLETESASTTTMVAEVLTDGGSEIADEIDLPVAVVDAGPSEDVEPLRLAPQTFDTVADDDSDDDDDDADDDGDEGHVAEVSTLPRADEFPAAGDHPTPLAAAVSGGGMVAATAAMPAGAIERDPSVNKSLLLRLIAGVRGL